MFEPTFSIGSTTFLTFTTGIGLAIVISAGYVLYHTPKEARLKTVDVLIGGLLIGVILGRVEHVALNWNYFAYNTAEITQITAGGLEWHGILLGACVGMVLVGRWRGVKLAPILDRLTLAIPLIGLAAWWGCWSASCRYGAEVATLADYPAWMVWDAPDIFGIYAPRFHTQLIGMGLSGMLFTLTLVLFMRNVIVGKRFWLLLFVMSGINFFIGFLLGDYAIVVNHLRLTQYLDLMVMLFSGILIFRYEPT